MALANEVELPGERKAAGILRMATVDRVNQRPHLLFWVAVDPGREVHEVDRQGLLERHVDFAALG